MSLALANTLSFIPSMGFLYLLGDGILAQKTKYLIHAVLYLIVTHSTNWIKILMKPHLKKWAWMKRPAAACDCNLTNQGGKVGGEPGFPSGHMTSTTFLLTPFWLRGSLPTTWFVGVIAAVAWARWYKSCHNVPQILGGITFGCVAAYLLRSFIT